VKEYTKPEVEIVDFVAENVAEGNVGTTSSEENNPW
jgi:hypothetical protein